MVDDNVQAEPSDVSAEDGVVVLHCPGEVRVKMTPDAAEETAEQLIENALKARGQRYFLRDREG